MESHKVFAPEIANDLLVVSHGPGRAAGSAVGDLFFPESTAAITLSNAFSRARPSVHSGSRPFGRFEPRQALTVWFRDRQRPDGSISKGEKRFNSAESTAASLIQLALLEYPRDEIVDRALLFLYGLTRPEDGSVRSASDAVEQGWPGGPPLPETDQAQFPEDIGIRRTYPAALTLIALTAWDADAAHIRTVRDFLLNEFPSRTWGAFPEARPRPAYTAVAIWALTAAGEHPSRFRSAAAYLRSTQHHDGRWSEEEEFWTVRNADGDQVSSSPINATALCAVALARLNKLSNLRALFRARRYLAYGQQ